MVMVSVILPVYNESECINKTFDSVLEYSQKKESYHFIFVNDGSTDNTAEILAKRVSSTNLNKFTLVSYAANKGKGYAVKKGVEQAKGDYICFIDSDLAYSLDHLELLVDKLQEFDVVIGCRNLVPENLTQPKLSRRLSGMVFNLISRKIFNLHYRDMQAGLKGFRNAVAKELFKNQKSSGFSFDVELLCLAKKQGYFIGEIPARISEKHRYKISKVNLIKDSIRMFIELLAIKLREQNNAYQ